MAAKRKGSARGAPGSAAATSAPERPANTPVASTQARPTHDVTSGPDAAQDSDGRYVAPARTAGGFAGSAPSPRAIPPQYPAMPQSSPDRPLAGSIGATGTSVMAGILVNEDYNPDFGWRKGVEIYDQMRRSNGTVKAIEQLLAMPLRAATWTIKPASDKPEDKQIASFVESALLHEIEFTTPEGVEQHQTWDDILRHACLMMTYGFMPFELVWREDDAGWTKWAQWMPLLPKTVWRWWVNQQTDLVGIQQRTYINYGWYYRDIPASKLLLFTHEREGNNFEGMSVFRAAYPHWFYLQQYYKIQAVGIERNAVTPPIGHLAPMASTGDRDNLFQVVQNMRVGESMGAVIQAGEAIEYPSNHQTSGADVQGAIDHHMQMVAQAAVASFLALGASSKGAYNLAESLINMLLTIEQARAQYICDTINAGPIKQLVRYNFGTQAVYPQLCVSRLTATDITRVANALAALAGYIPPSNEITDFLTKMIGLPEAAHSEIQATNPSGGSDDGGESEAVKETQRMGQNIIRQNFNPALSEPRSLADLSVKHSGVMVAFMLDHTTAQKLAWADGEPANDLHITLAFLGDSADLTPRQRKTLQRVVVSYVEDREPLSAQVTGIRSFPPGPHSDGKRPVYAAVDIPGIQRWRAGLVKALKDAGLPVDETFDYKPHITLAYIPKDQSIPQRRTPRLKFMLSSITCAVGDEHSTYAIGSEQGYTSSESDIVTEARLLREAIGALTGQDAVEQGLAHRLKGEDDEAARLPFDAETGYTLFNPNHDARGRFAPGGAGGVRAAGGKGGAGKGKAAGGPAGKGAANPRAPVRKNAAGVRIKPVDMQAQAARQAAHKAKFERAVDAEQKGREADLVRAHKLIAQQQARVDKAAAKHADLAARVQAHKAAGDLKPAQMRALQDREALAKQDLAMQRSILAGQKGALPHFEQAVQPGEARAFVARWNAQFRGEKTVDLAAQAKAARAAKIAQAKAAKAQAAQQAAHAAARAKAQLAYDADNKGLVEEENGKWKGGEKSDRPPFTPDEFRAGRAAAQANPDAGINASYRATIAGKEYIIKDVEDRAGLGNWNPQQFADIDSGAIARYESAAEAASPKIAEAMGLKGESLQTYTFDEGGHHYVAIPYRADLKAVGAGKYEQAFAKSITPEHAADLFVHEYIAGDPDRHGGNYLYNPRTGRALQIDHGRSFRMLGTKADTFTELHQVWKMNGRAAGKPFGQGIPLDHARIAALASTEHEAKAISIMRRYRLDRGIPGVQARFAALRALAASGKTDITTADLK